MTFRFKTKNAIVFTKLFSFQISIIFEYGVASIKSGTKIITTNFSSVKTLVKINIFLIKRL